MCGPKMLNVREVCSDSGSSRPGTSTPVSISSHKAAHQTLPRIYQEFTHCPTPSVHTLMRRCRHAHARAPVPHALFFKVDVCFFVVFFLRNDLA